MRTSPLRSAIVLFLGWLLPMLSLAHGAHGAPGADGFAAGFLHPLLGVDHLAAMIAVGLWSALAHAHWRQRLLAPLVFVMVLLGSALATQTHGLHLLAIEPMLAVSLLVLGLLVALRWRLPAAIGALLIGAYAVFHGAAHGSVLQGHAALIGMVAATALLHAAGLAIGHVLRRQGPWWPRAAGAATGLLGAALLLG